MQKNEHAYFATRAEKEMEAAEKASGAEAKRVHSMLAGYYLDRVNQAKSDSAEG